MGVRQRKHQEWSVYARSLLQVSVVVAAAAAIQVSFIYERFEPRFLVIPALVAATVGILLGRLAVLRQRLHRKSAEFRAIVDIAQEFTYLRTVTGRYDYVSPSCEALTGYTQDEFYASDSLMDQLVHPEDRHRWSDHVHHINDAGAPESLDIRLVTKSGDTVWITHICAPVYDERNRQIGVRSTNLDITQRMHDQHRIERMAHYDPLTDLPNRRLLETEIKRRVEAGQPFAVMFLDLSRFKNINDSLGHSFGDKLLREIAERLQKLFVEGALLCRFGGDEFVIVHSGLTDIDSAMTCAQALLDEVERPILIDHNEFHISGTVGVACYPEDGDKTETLVRNADSAMYWAKRTSGVKIAAYQAHFSHQAAQFISTESDIYRAVKQAEFVPYYQPKVDLETGRVVALEALARWHHPERGLVSPAQFIPVAEETGQINDIGKQILARVLDDLCRWQGEGHAVPVAVNISPRQFTDRDLWEQLHEGVSRTGCSPSLLELEITEQVFLADIDAAAERLHDLRAKGFPISLDDFGTGYSSFNHLRRLPISTLKLDRSFVTDVEHEAVSRAILRATSGICDELEMTLVAEGVETEAQRNVLLEYGCRLAQGFLFYRPMPAKEIDALLASPEPDQAKG